MELIVSHVNADFDAFASMVAAKRLYPKAVLVFPGSQEKKVRDFIEAFHPVDVKRVKDIDLEKVRKLVVVDSKSPNRIGPLKPLLDKPKVTVHLYDHHPHGEGDIRGKLEVIEPTGSSSTIFTEIFRQKGYQPTPMEATLLTLAIYEETGNLLFPSTTERDLKAAAWLLRCGASLRIVSAYMKTELTTAEVEILSELIKTAEDKVIGGVRVRIAKFSPEGYIGDAAHLAHRMMEMEPTDAVVLVLRMEGKVVMIGRSRAKELDIAQVLERFGGGGHPNAASATLKEQPLEVIRDKLLEALEDAVKPMKVARDVMTKPVITIDAAKSIKEAEDAMTRYGVNVLPVEEDDRYVGIITREIVEKALFHGFHKSVISEFATTEALTAEPDTLQRTIEKTMIEQNQRFMPILTDGKVEGAITRTDLLRGMYEDYLRKTGIGETVAEERHAISKNLAPWLRNRYPRQIGKLLERAGEIANELGYRAYLVGGSVRDLLRGEENLDIDIVIEGDGIAFAKRFATEIGAKISSHERFSTAKVISKDLRIDVATARTEYYESPAALPTVEMSSIKKDLYRRDFTINTLAISLNPDVFGQLVDFFGGQRDLKDRKIRVLHNLSFIEDPTRAFRAVRFAERFGFRLSKQTEGLIKSVIKLELFDKLTGSRLYDELSLIFSESDPVGVVRKLASYGLLGVVHSELELDEELEALITAVHDTLLWFGLSFQEEEPDASATYLMALCAALKGRQREAMLKRLAVPPKMRRLVLDGARNAVALQRRLPLTDAAKIFDALTPLSLEAVLFTMALARDEKSKKEVSRFLLEYRKVRALITGADLKKMGIEPGPVYSEIFKTVLAEKLRGRLKTRANEIRLVKEQYLKVKTA